MAAADLGVSTAFLRRFVEQHGISAETTTAEVVEKFVKPQTAAKQCSLVQQLQQGQAAGAAEEDASMVGPATVYVSHAWTSSFADAVQVMLEHAEKSKDKKKKKQVFFWIDAFCVNQHTPHAPTTAEWFRDGLQQRMEAMGEVLVVLTPHKNPVPLRRLWCLWEMHSALQLKSRRVKLSVSLPADQRLPAVASATAESSPLIETMMRVDLARAAASDKSDEAAILEAARNSSSSSSSGGSSLHRHRHHRSVRRARLRLLPLRR
eukprot:m.82960 g.82960  ORF g.82960 m.82960 type:complete len:263 (+) comp14947_c0_seq3:118-906(+)